MFQWNSMMAIAKAHTNIALIKYWGKRDEQLFLPMNSSLSITLDKFYTTTAVQFCEDLKEDIFILNKNIASDAETKKISSFLDKIRKMAGKQLYAVVKSDNKVPASAGFASSASGYAALAAAAVKAIGLNLGETALSRIARQGSGSACRSIFGGYVEWQKGVEPDGMDSYARPIAEGQNWQISILSVLLNSETKPISSRNGMKRTVETSPFYNCWPSEAEKDLQIAKTAIRNHDFSLLGEVVEANALKMHATTLGAKPPFLYWQGSTLDVMNEVHHLRANNIQAYYTMDAGPNVKVLCQPKDEQLILDRLLSIPAVQEIHVCRPGPGVEYLADPNSIR